MPQLTGANFKLETDASVTRSDRQKRQPRTFGSATRGPWAGTIGSSLQYIIDFHPFTARASDIGFRRNKKFDKLFLPYVIIRATPVLPYLNKSAKETLHKVRLIPPFFGEVLAERLKTAKALQKSGYDLKAPPPGPPTGTPRKKDAGAN